MKDLPKIGSVVLLLLSLLLNGGFIVEAQNIHVADSLKNEWNHSEGLSTMERFRLLRGIYWEHPNPDSCIKYTDIALVYADTVQNDKMRNYMKHSAYLYSGYAYNDKGDLSQGLDQLFKSLQYADLLGNNSNTVVEIAIAYSYTSQSNFKMAQKYYNMARPKYEAAGDSTELANLYINKGEAFRLEGAYDSAMFFFKKADPILLDLDNELSYGYNQGNIGMVYEVLGMYTEARDKLTNAIRILQKYGAKGPIIAYELSMSDVYKDLGKYKEAIALAEKCYNNASKMGYKEYISEASFKLAALYKLVNEFEKAYERLSDYLIYKDSVVNKDVIREMADIRTDYELAKKENEVLKKDAELDKLKAEKKVQQVVGVFLTIVLLLLSFSFIVLYKNNKIRKQTSALLSEQKEEIEAQRDQLEALNSTKDRFFSIISHDLRGPVHAFRGLSRLIGVYISQRNIKELEELNADFSTAISGLTSMLDGLLDWALSQQGAFIYSPEKISLSELSEGMNEVFAHFAKAKNISLHFSVENGVYIWGDKNSVYTVFRNLINNAIKFTAEGGEIEFKGGSYADDKVQVQVIDNGIGMSQEKVTTLFNFDEKKRSWGTDGEKGLGLGLQLVHQFVDLNEGTVKVQSKEGRGTTFSVLLPAYIAEN